MTLEQLTGSIKDQLTYQALYDKVAPAPTITDAEIQKYYDANKAQFQTTAQSKLSHILISVSSTATAEEAAKAKATAESVLKQLQAGADFATLAKENTPRTRAQGPAETSAGRARLVRGGVQARQTSSRRAS